MPHPRPLPHCCLLSGLVVLPGALPPAQQHELTTSALVDYVEPPARTNHVLHYGLVTGLWRASEQGLRLNWRRKDDAHGGSWGGLQGAEVGQEKNNHRHLKRPVKGCGNRKGRNAE